MNLGDTIRWVFGSSADISDAVTKVFMKHTGKQKGYDAIEQNIRDTISKNHKQTSGGAKMDTAAVDEYVKTRLGYMQNTFKRLNDPMKNRSDERAELVRDTETNDAKWFGKSLGYQDSGRNIEKIWVDFDGCDLCSANADQGPIPVGEVFDSGHYAPGGHPGCICELRYVEVS